MSDAEADIRRIAREVVLDPAWPSRLRVRDPMQPLVISVVRDERPRLPDFLDHYRTAGAAHFLIVDNGSADGTRELLAGEPDVDLFEVDAPFSAAAKHGWITRLVEDYGDRWYLLADADEHAVFHGAANLATVCQAVQRLERRRVRAALLDMYGDKPLGALTRAPGQSLLSAYPFFDPSGYVEKREAALTTRTGGPRQRVLSRFDRSFAPQLTKYPLFRLRAGEVLISPHYIHPPLTGDDPCWIALLHFKFDADAAARIADAVRRRQYWRDSYEYRIYERALRHCPDLSFVSAASRRYSGAAELVELGIIDKVPISARAGLLTAVKSLMRRRNFL